MNPFEMTAEDCDRCRFVKDCTPLYVPPCYDGAAVKAAKQARADVLDLLIAYRKAQSKEFGIQTVWEGEGAYILELRQQGGKP